MQKLFGISGEFKIKGWPSRQPLFSGSSLVWLATAVWLLMFWLALSSLHDKSPTFDEQGFITRGLGYLRGENRHMRVGHPLGVNALNAALLVFDETVQLPTDDPAWALPNFHRPSEQFMWEIGNDVQHVMFLARLPSIWLGMILTALAARWALEMTNRRWAGLLALGLLALDPNLLAHTRLATTDLGLAAGALIATFTLWRFLNQPTWGRAFVAGIGFGLLQNSKFTAGLFIPLLAVVIGIAFVDRWHQQDARVAGTLLLKLIVAYPLAGFLTLWAAYGFQIGTLPDNLPTLPQLSGLTLPLSHHLEQLLDIGGRLQKGTPAFLLGQYRDSGWWYYFPVAFLLKTPFPTLILLIGAGVIAWRDRLNKRWFHTAVLLLPALGYFAIALTTDINLGYRHLLPILPLLIIFIAIHIRHIPLAGIALGWLLLVTLWIYPHFLPFFNVLAGGPDNGWQALVDSNIDWGQDLAGLQVWLAGRGQQEMPPLWLSYFGEGRPDYYGIDYIGLDSFPPRLMNPLARPFYPADPAPGYYAISVTNLQGVHFADHDQFAWFRHREPIAKIGYSIFIYDVPARGESVPIALAGVQLDELDRADHALLNSNNLVPRWFDGTTSLQLPTQEVSWLAIGADVILPPNLATIMMDRFTVVASNERYTLYHGRFEPALVETAAVRFANETGLAALLSPTAITLQGNQLSVTTRWQQHNEPQPIKIFLHLVGPDETIVAQWDGFGAAWEGWREGDMLIQNHQLTLPTTLVAGRYRLWAGLYHPATGQRWQTATGNRRLLGDVVYLPH